jgi:D-glycero-alpha-D-manno-heptose 1-phosphate guanylyltransferase
MDDQAFDAIVLAGGLGTRLRSAVPDRPKPLAPIAGKPFLDYLLAHLQRVGVRRVILSIGYMGELIEAQYGARFQSLDMVYSKESTPLGTGGALRQALQLSQTSHALALNGDTLLQFDPRAFMTACRLAGKPLGIVTRKVDDTARYGRCALTSDVVTEFGEKGMAGEGLINAGVYSLRQDLFEGFELPERFSFESEFIEPNLPRLAPYGCRTSAYFIDIGIPEDFERAQTELPQLNG